MATSKIKKTLKEWFQFLHAAQIVAGMDLPVTVSYRLSRNLTLVQNAMTPADNKRIALIKKYSRATLNKDGQTEIDPAKARRFEKDMDELHAEVLEIELGPPVDVADLGDAKIRPAVFTVASELFTCSNEDDSEEEAEVPAPDLAKAAGAAAAAVADCARKRKAGR